jgi:hypothetical protein
MTLLCYTLEPNLLGSDWIMTADDIDRYTELCDELMFRKKMVGRSCPLFWGAH